MVLISTRCHIFIVLENFISEKYLQHHGWVMFLYNHFKNLKDLMFQDQHAFQHLKPKAFKYFNIIRCAIDCPKFSVKFLQIMLNKEIYIFRTSTAPT